MAALITVEQLTARPGFDGVSETSAEVVLEDVSALVVSVADIDPAWTAETLPPEMVPVIVSMARRGLLNPLGKSGEQLGDYGWQAQGGGTSGIYATRAERRIIRKAAGRSGVSSVDLDSPLPLPPWRAGGGFEDRLLDSL